MWKEKTTKKEKADTTAILPNDEKGDATVNYLKKVRKSASLISTISAGDRGSLGLHPLVYFYGVKGKFQPVAFLATIKFVRKLKERGTDALIKFTASRAVFEDFLVKHRHFINALSHGYGSRTRPVDAIVTMYDMVFDEVSAGNVDHKIIATKLLKNDRLQSLKSAMKGSKPIRSRTTLSKSDKSGAYLREAIDSPVLCKICGARLHVRSITSDHIVRIQDGGKGGSKNAQPTHPFCNHGYKEHLRAKEKSQAKSL